VAACTAALPTVPRSAAAARLAAAACPAAAPPQTTRRSAKAGSRPQPRRRHQVQRGVRRLPPAATRAGGVFKRSLSLMPLA
jgi:hypothetical protein